MSGNRIWAVLSGRASVGTSRRENADLIERFYAAFAARDGGAMAACYAPDARFSDPCS